MRPQCDNNYWLTSIGQIFWISLIPRHVFALCELLFLDAKVDFISQTTDKPRVRQACSICLCAIHVLLVVFWLGSCALMSNTAVWVFVFELQQKNRPRWAAEWRETRDLGADLLLLQPAIIIINYHTVLKREPWHFTRAGVRLVWWKGLPTTVL